MAAHQIGLGRFQEHFQEFCSPDLLQRLACEGMCAEFSTNPECTEKCVEGVGLIHLLRQRICHLIVPAQESDATLDPSARLLARSFIHLQSGILLTLSSRAAYTQWKASKTALECLKNLPLPVVGVVLSLTGFVVAIIV